METVNQGEINGTLWANDVPAYTVMESALNLCVFLSES